MKLSFAISVQDTKFDAIASGSYYENIALMSELGFDGVELAIRNPELINIEAILKLLESTKLKVAAIGTGQAYVDEGLSLSSGDISTRTKAICRLKKHIDLASILNSQIIIGLIRGNIGGRGSDKAISLEYFKNSIIEIVDYAFYKNVLITIEPLNRYECNFLNRAEEVVHFINEINCPIVKMLLDTFHMNIEEKDIYLTFSEFRNYLSHVHFADSNRRSPGDGHLNFKEIIRTLKDIGYNDFISGEMLPYPNLEGSMKKFIDFIRGGAK